MNSETNEKTNRRRLVGVIIAALVIMAAGGIGNRLLLARIDDALKHPLELARPLATFPLTLDSWRGKDVPMDDATIRIAGEDDYINRQYVDSFRRREVSLYVGYIGRPRVVMAHRPDVCYPAHGLKKVSQKPILMTGSKGEQIPGLLYEFRSPNPGGPKILVLTVYLMNGEYVNDIETVSKYNARSVSLFSDQKAYMTRIQIATSVTVDSSEDLRVLSDFAAKVIEPIIAMMPKKNAIEHIQRD